MAPRYRILIAVAAGLLALPIVLCAALLVLGNTDRGRRLIEHSTERLTNGQVSLQGEQDMKLEGRLAASEIVAPGKQIQGQ